MLVRRRRYSSRAAAPGHLDRVVRVYKYCTRLSNSMLSTLISESLSHLVVSTDVIHNTIHTIDLYTGYSSVDTL